MTEGDVLWQVKNELQSLDLDNRCLVIFDQVEELFVNDSPENDLKYKSLLELLVSKSSEQVKFILSFRKEFLLEVKKLLQATRLDFDEVLLSNLNRTGIIEAVRGITSSALTRRYKVEFEQGLPEEIAGDIINDRVVT